MDKLTLTFPQEIKLITLFKYRTTLPFIDKKTVHDYQDLYKNLS